LMFAILSSQAVYVSGIEVWFLDSAGALATSALATDTAILLEDGDMKIVSWSERSGVGTGFALSINRPVWVNDGGKSEVYINVALGDGAFAVSFMTEYYFVPPTVNG